MASADFVSNIQFNTGRFNLVHLGQNNLIVDRRLIEHIDIIVRDQVALKSVSRINQHTNPAQGGPAAQKSLASTAVQRIRHLFLTPVA